MNIQKILKRSGVVALTIALTVMLGMSKPVVADEAVPDLKGTWNAEVLGISLGDTAKGIPVNTDTNPNVGIIHIEMIIDFQDGRAIAGLKKHHNGNDRFVAVFKSGNKSLHGTDAEGDMELTILPDLSLIHI